MIDEFPLSCLTARLLSSLCSKVRLIPHSSSADIAAHCLDILRQQLMCTVDTGIFGQVWVHKDHPEPFVDFNTAHRCRNFDAIRRWAGDNQLPEMVASDFLRPPASRDAVYDEIP